MEVGLPAKMRLWLGFAEVEGRCAGGIAFQDALKHIHVTLVTRLPASYGPGKQSRHPSFNLNVVQPSKTNGPCRRT